MLAAGNLPGKTRQRAKNIGTRTAMTSANRVRLGIFVPRTGMSGAEVAIVNLLHALPHDQLEIYLFAPPEQPLRQIAQEQGYQVCDYPRPHFFSTSLEVGQRRFLNPFAII